jgi:hypothetical protein
VARATQHRQRGVGRVSLRDTPGVEGHAGLRDSDGARPGVDRQQPVAGYRTRGRKLLGSRKFDLPPRAAPEPGERADSDVKGAVGPNREILRRLQDCQQILADRDRLTDRTSRDAAQLAVRAVVAQGAVELRDTCEGGIGRRVGFECLMRVEHHANGGAHMRL